METIPCKIEGKEDGKTLFFIHGWPDDERVWDGQVAHFKEQYRCLRVNLPHFVGREEAAKHKHRSWGYNFDEITYMLANTIQENCTKNGRVEAVTVVCHDWGAHYGFYLQNMFPKLVEKMIVFDVGPPRFEQAGLKHLPITLIAGIVYQYLLAFAFLITAVPLIGNWIGDSICVGMATFFKRHLKNSRSGLKITASCCYPYYYYHRNYWLELFRLTRFIGTSRHPVPTCPCQFFYGAGKGFKFHSEHWEKRLLQREECEVHALPCQHWVQIEECNRVNNAMDEWFAKMNAPQ